MQDWERTAKIQALEIAIDTLKRNKCPTGEWPSVKVLRRIRDELLERKEL